jgi:hypothetical protein
MDEREKELGEIDLRSVDLDDLVNKIVREEMRWVMEDAMSKKDAKAAKRMFKYYGGKI